MNEQLAAFLEKWNTEQAETKKRDRDDLLLRMGLSESVKEYAPDSILTLFDANVAGYDKMETLNGKRRFCRNVIKPIEITDEEYQILLTALGDKAKAVKEPQKADESDRTGKPPINVCYTVVPSPVKTSRAAVFFKVLSVLVWIAGIILSLGAGLTGSGYPYSAGFNFGSFILSLLMFTLYGFLVFFSAEMIQNIQNISDRLEGMTIQSKN